MVFPFVYLFPNDQATDGIRHVFMQNAKVSDGSQPPPTLNLFLSESAGSRSLHRLVRLSFVVSL
jgi:hypothetical protein